MDFIDFMTDDGYHIVNLKILNSLNRDALNNLCQASKKLEEYIKQSCRKWALLEKLQDKKSHFVLTWL